MARNHQQIQKEMTIYHSNFISGVVVLARKLLMI